MDHIVDPYLKRHKLLKFPLKRMLLGGSIGGIAFVFAGCIEMYLEVSMMYYFKNLPCKLQQKEVIN